MREQQNNFGDSVLREEDGDAGEKDDDRRVSEKRKCGRKKGKTTTSPVPTYVQQTSSLLVMRFISNWISTDKTDTVSTANN